MAELLRGPPNSIVQAQKRKVGDRSTGRERRREMNGIQRPDRFTGERLPRTIDDFGSHQQPPHFGSGSFIEQPRADRARLGIQIQLRPRS